MLVIVGPTAVGKSALGVKLARKYNGEVISADSRQVYRGLDIGTGKITKREMQGIPHHLLDVANPLKQFSVAAYQKLAREKIKEISLRGKLPIIVGGTGLYVQAIVNDVSFPEVPPNQKLRKKLKKKTADELFAMLKKLDNRRAKTIDSHNPRRLIRAIEIATALGKVPAFTDAQRKDIEPFFIGVTLPQDRLKRKISIRLFARIRKCKMIDEVKKLHEQGLAWKRMEELGLEYRYVSRFLRGLILWEEMLAELQSEICRYAKRQMTWFKRDKRIKWFFPKEGRKLAKEVRNFLKS